MTSSLHVRAKIIEMFRRDLIGPGDNDHDLASERLNENPSRWYLTGFLAPAGDPLGIDGDVESQDPSIQEEADINSGEPDTDGAGGAAGDTEEPEAPSTKRRFLPSSIGLTVLLSVDVTEIQARISWGDYIPDSDLPQTVVLSEPAAEKNTSDDRSKSRTKPMVKSWARVAKKCEVAVPIHDGRGTPIELPDSTVEQLQGRGLTLETHSRVFNYRRPDQSEESVRALTVFLVNRRATVDPFYSNYSDISFVFQAELELTSDNGFHPRHDLSGVHSEDADLRLADLHYRDVKEWAVGRNTAASWHQEDERRGIVKRVWTTPLPTAEVERVAPNEDEEIKSLVTFEMEALADAANQSADALHARISRLPELYDAWIGAEREKLKDLSVPRKETAVKLIDEMEQARNRISSGIELLWKDKYVRSAFRFMNLAVASAARRRNAGPNGDPDQMPSPAWRPFQLAFIILNIVGIVRKTHSDREIADLLFFPTGGGKTEAYLGLAALIISHRRLTSMGVLGAGISVIMRYTLRLLTLDQLARAAGVICALELMRIDPKNVTQSGRKLLGDWPIEIGLWVGSDASPNQLGGKGNRGENTAVKRVERYRNGRDKRAPAPLKACPWCGTEFTRDSFACTPNINAPTNLAINCVNTDCDFTQRPLPVLTVDEPIYRRLPAFLIATVDKFASLPWVGESGAFFCHVNRYKDELGFFGASERSGGTLMENGWELSPPDLIIQDELHLISGPLGTVAGLYEAAIDQLSSREIQGQVVRPKIVASTATVRRASDQIKALFDRDTTSIFPPPGIDRSDSFFAKTVSSTEDPARLYMGIPAHNRGPKLVFLRSLTTLLAAAQATFENESSNDGKLNPSDPYMTALCYFNALRELGGARRIVEDEVRDRASRYGSQRHRLYPDDFPFVDREIKEPMELTSRESTDNVALAKQRLGIVFDADSESVDVALATNMISVGLDITRLGLMMVQGQPKTSAEYIQATSRVGRDPERPGLVVTILNLHKPRDRTHFEHFGYYHQTFYRSVEATSVTPWAARSLDRGLAAVIVAAIRHTNPMLTPEASVVELKNYPSVREKVREAIIQRAPAEMVAGGHEILRSMIDDYIDAWISTSNDQSEGGSRFAYSRKKSPHRLLHMPLAPELANLSESHRKFVAGRSMRDVEPEVALKVRDPYGRKISNGDD